MFFDRKKHKNHYYTQDNYERGLSDKERFDYIMQTAQRVVCESKYFDKENHPICDMIRLLGRKLQSTSMEFLFWYGDVDSEMPNLFPENIFIPHDIFIACGYPNDKVTYHGLEREVNCDNYINLSTDLILPWPWRKERLLNCLKYIGNDREWGTWNQDENNHHVIVWLPMGISWVYGGNHSITVGIVQGGSIKPDRWYDISAIYNYIKTDGVYFYRIVDNKKMYHVRNVEFAAIFEIGRIMYENNICFQGLII